MSAFIWKGGYPHKGWINTNIEDLGEGNYFKCEMCSNPVVRYKHTMEHLEIGAISTGCDCAEKMSEEYKGVGSAREEELKKLATSRKNFYVNGWHESEQNTFRKLGKDRLSITEVNNSYYWLVEKDTDEYSNVFNNTPCSTELESKQKIWDMYKDEGWK